MRITRVEALELLDLDDDKLSDDPNSLRKAFNREALKWHPDKNKGCLEAAERFKKVSAAYSRLQQAPGIGDNDSDEDDYDEDVGMDEDTLAMLFMVSNMMGGMPGMWQSPDPLRRGAHVGCRVGPSSSAHTAARGRFSSSAPRATGSRGIRVGPRAHAGHGVHMGSSFMVQQMMQRGIFAAFRA
ncbi:hypothetical protein V8C86DRAFT_2475117 [Haematococcus lacustris]